MTNYVVFLKQLLLERFIELIVSSASVSIFCIATCAFRWKLVSSKETISGSSRVERAVDMEERVALFMSAPQDDTLNCLSTYLVHGPGQSTSASVKYHVIRKANKGLIRAAILSHERRSLRSGNSQHMDNRPAATRR